MDKSTILRQISMLKMLRKFPGFDLTKEIHQRLIDEGFNVTKRTIERDLLKLSDVMGLTSGDNPERNEWSYINHSRELLPALSPNEALLLIQAKLHLQNMMPFKALQSLEPRFNKAEATLSQNKLMANWQDKIKVVQGMVPLIITEISDEIREVIYDTVLKAQQVKISYQKNSGEVGNYSLSMFGLIIKDYVQYLVASKLTSPDVLQLFKLSQIQTVEREYLDNLHCSADVSAFIQADVTGYMINKEPIKLKMKIAGPAFNLLTSTKLCDDQKLEYFTTSSGRKCALLTATVDFTYTLVHFLLGYGKLVQVLEPKSLVDELEERKRGDVF
jgi:predicted DNA-binding transcriptional regulator YafY